MNNAVPTSPLLQQMGHPHSYPNLGQISNPYEQQPPGKELNKYASLKAVGAALSFQQESWSLSDGFSTMAPSRSFQFPQKCFQGLQYGDVHRADKNGARNRTRVAFPAGMVLV